MSINKTNSLKYFREEIDTVDEQIIALLAKRMEVVKKVGVYKKEREIPPLDPKRWQEVLTTKRQIAKELNLSADLVEDIYERIHKEALLIEQ